VNSGAPEGYTVPAPQVAPIMLIQLQAAVIITISKKSHVNYWNINYEPRSSLE